MTSLQHRSGPNQSTPKEYLPILKDLNKDHRTSLRSLIQAHLSLPRPPAQAQIISLDAQGFDVEYEILHGFWPGGTSKKGVRIPWGEELSAGAKGVKVKFGKMAKEAELKRNKKYPILYSLPPDLPLHLFFIALLLYISHPSHTPVSLYNHPNILKHLHHTIPLVLKVLGLAHAFEAVAIFILALRRGASLGTAILWAANALPVGFYTFFRFKQLNPQA